MNTNESLKSVIVMIFRARSPYMPLILDDVARAVSQTTVSGAPSVGVCVCVGAHATIYTHNIHLRIKYVTTLPRVQVYVHRGTIFTNYHTKPLVYLLNIVQYCITVFS